MTFLFKIKIQTGGGSLSWTQAKKKESNLIRHVYRILDRKKDS